MISARQRVLAVLDGQGIDRFPVAAPYLFLTQCDHWCEVTGRPAWTFYEWLLQEPGVHVRMYHDFYQRLPFDILQPWPGPSREQRENLEVIHHDGKHFYRDRRTGELTPLRDDLHQRDGPANQTQRVFDREDVRRLLPRRSAEAIIASGVYDHISEARRSFPDSFLMNGVVGTFWQCTGWVGETRLFSMLYDAPELIHHLSARLLENTIEDIRALVAAGEDAIYIDDALTTNDMISVDFYERFSMPYVKSMVDEIHALGRKAVHIISTGSPITPRTPLSRIRRFIELGHELGKV